MTKVEFDSELFLPIFKLKYLSSTNSRVSLAQAYYFKTDQPDSYVLFLKKVPEHNAHFSTSHEIQIFVGNGKPSIYQTQLGSLCWLKKH
jgi:hypothetical protein